LVVFGFCFLNPSAISEALLLSLALYIQSCLNNYNREERRGGKKSICSLEYWEHAKQSVT
jgi:hypothetical protein